MMNRMKKWLSVLLTLSLLCALAVSCAAAEPSVRVAALKGPTAMGMVKMMSDDQGATYDFTIHAAIDEITPKLVKGEVDIAAVPANLASVLYNNTQGKVKVLAINTLGVIYIVENGSTVQSVEDLRGRTIYASGKGATPEYALNYILKGNGIDPEKDVTIEYKSEHSECLSALLANEGSVAMLPQPFVTTAQMKQAGVQIVLDMTEEWAKLQEGSDHPSAMLTGVVVATTDFLESHPEAAGAFLDAYHASVDYANNEVEAAAALIGQYDIVPEAVAQKALPYCRIVCIEGAEMQTRLSGYLQVLFEQNPKAVGGAVPDDGFYFQR